MGDIADDIMDGNACSRCGVYFEESHGYPILCKRCYDEELKDHIKNGGSKKYFEKQLGLQRAFLKQIT